MTQITVRGCCSMSRSPERAIVHAMISDEGPVLDPVYQRVARDLESVKASISPMVDPDHGPVTCWSADQLRMWSNRPRNRDGGQLPLTHHVSVGVEVEFSDFAALSAWLGSHAASTEGFRVTNVDWKLTPASRDDVLREVRNRAVLDAVARAQQYADALGLGAIQPVAVADAGMLPDTAGAAGAPAVGQLRRAAAFAADGPDVELVPKDIEMSVDVDARFVAGP